MPAEKKNKLPVFPATQPASVASSSNGSALEDDIAFFQAATTEHGRRKANPKTKMKPILPRASALSRGSRELSNAITTTTFPVVATLSTARRSFSILNRPPPNYPGHVPLTRIERAGLAIGSGIISLVNPYRGGTPDVVSLPLPLQPKKKKKLVCDKPA